VTTAITNLVARKEKLLKQLEATEDADQRSDIRRQLEQVDTALESLACRNKRANKDGLSCRYTPLAHTAKWRCRITTNRPARSLAYCFRSDDGFW
jgi:hypothetical protein